MNRLPFGIMMLMFGCRAELTLDDGATDELRRRHVAPAPDLAGTPDLGSTVPPVAYYVRAGATGTGTDWSSAAPALPAALQRGVVYYLAAGSYPSPTLHAASGTGTVTVKKATLADHGTSAGWSDGYAGAATFTGTLTIAASDLELDGGGRADWKSGYGFVLIGPAPGGPGLLIGDGVSRVVVRYLELFGHGSNAPGNESGGPGGDNAVWLNGVSSDITFSHNYAHSWAGCMVKTYTSSIESSLFEDNWFEWNASSPAAHAEGVFPWGMNNTVFRDNVWVDIEGTGVILLGAGGNNQIYGNVVYWTPAYPHPGQYGAYIGNGTFTNWSSYTSVGDLFYDNTIIVPPSGGIEFGIKTGGLGSGTARNNLYYCSAPRNVYTTGIDSDYDAFFGLTHDPEPHAQDGSGDPFVSSATYDFHLAAHTAAGLALGAPYDIDPSGVTRTSWDRGAFEYR